MIFSLCGLIVCQGFADSAEGKESNLVSLGPMGGSIYKMAYNPHKCEELYAISHEGPNYIYRSNTLGEKWEVIAQLDEGYLDIGIDPNDPNIIFVLAPGGIYKSIDKGQNWQKHIFGGTFTAYDMSIHPFNSDIIFVCGKNVYSQGGYRTVMAVMKSVDGGINWTSFVLTPESNVGCAQCLAINPLNPDELYTGGSYAKEGWTVTGKLFKCIEGGITWTEIIYGSKEEIPASIALDPNNPQRVYIGAFRGVFWSFNGGQTWQKNKFCSIQGHSVAVDPTDSNIIYSGGINSFFRSTDGGQTWGFSNLGIHGTGCFCILAIPYNKLPFIDRPSAWPSMIFYADHSGIYKSIDGGYSWKGRNKGINATFIPTFAIATSAPNIIYAASCSDGLYKSYDFGLSWQRLRNFSADIFNVTQINKIIVNPKNEDQIYLINDNYCMRSDDGGNSFVTIGDMYVVKDLVCRSDDPKRLYMTGILRDKGFWMGLCTSNDGGRNWEALKLPVHGNGKCIALDPYDLKRIYIAGQEKGKDYFFWTADKGLDWAKVEVAQNVLLYSICVDPHSVNDIYAATSGGMYKSSDYGMSWNKTSINTSSDCVYINPNSPNEIYASVRTDDYWYSRALVSYDQGASWIDITGDSAIPRILCFGTIPDTSVYLGTWGGGIFRYDLNEFDSPMVPKKFRVAKKSMNQIKLRWQYNKNKQHYFKIEKREKNRKWLLIAVLDPDVRSYFDSGLKENTSYRYRIRSFNNSSQSPYAKIVKAKTE